MTPATFEFKCRRCGRIFDGPVGAPETCHIHLVELLVTGKTNPIGSVLDDTNIHHCEDGGVGVGDIIGYRVTP